jgi:hypothetical protein
MEHRMNEDGLCGQRNWIKAAAVLSLALLTVVGCVDRNSRYDVAYAGQGAVVLKENPNPPKPAPQVVETHAAPPVETRPAGPSEKEIAMQRKIEELEAQSRALQNQSKELQAEIERLKRER